MAVWTQASTLYARIRTAGGTVRPRQLVGPAIRGQHLAPSAVLSLHRAQLVGWLAQAVGEGDGSAGTARVAQARDGGTFTTIALGTIPALGAGAYVSEAGVRVGYGSQGRAVVAWTGYEGGHFLVRQAGIRGAANNPSQSLTGVATLSQAGTDTVLSDLVVDPSGPTYALMLAGVRGNDPATPGGAVSVRASGGEEVAPAAAGAAQPFGAAATLLSDGRALAAWTTVGQGDAWSVRASPTRLPASPSSTTRGMRMPGRLDGTAALVTGASSGIGEATALALAAEGAAVAVVARRGERLRSLAAEIGRGGGTAHTIEADITDPAQPAAVVAEAVDRLGRLDTVVNNAGVMLLGPIVDAPADEWDRMFDLNVTALMRVAHAALPHLLEAAEQGPRNVADLVNVSSVAGRRVAAGGGVYQATKHAVGAFSEALRQEVTDRHVRVSLVEPGAVATELMSHVREEVREHARAALRGRASASRPRTSRTRSPTSSPGAAAWRSTSCS